MTTTHASRPISPRAPVPSPARVQGARPTHLRLVLTGEVAAVRPPLRLTRRGRAVLRGLVALVLAGLLAATALLMAHRADAADGPAPSVVVAHHIVLPGETLWGIATELAPGADPRDTIAAIVEFNALPSSALHAGQDLAIPPQLSRR
jgi:LysM domain